MLWVGMVAPGLPPHLVKEITMAAPKSEFPKTLTHKNGRERTVTTQAELVAANFDGFVENPAKPARKPRAKKTTARKPAAKTTQASATVETQDS